MIEQCTDKWRKHAYKGHQTVTYLMAAEKSVSEKAKQWSVSIACHGINQVDGTTTL